MTTIPETPGCKTAQLFRWILTGHQGVRSNTPSTPALARQSSFRGPAVSLKRASLLSVNFPNGWSRAPGLPIRRDQSP